MRAPALHGLEIAQEILLEINAQGLPEQTDGAAGKGNIVARLDAVQVFKEETATGEAILQVILRFQ